MRRRGLTTRDVGKAVELDHSAIARWLKGTRPYASSIAKLADYFRVPVDLLLDDSKDLPIEPAPHAGELPKPLSGSYARAVLSEIRQKNGEKKFTEFSTEENAKLMQATLLDAIPPEVLRAAIETVQRGLAEMLVTMAPMLPDNPNQLSPIHSEVEREVLAEEKRQKRTEARRMKHSQSSPAKAQGAAGR